MSRQQRNNRRDEGFTLVEIMVVVVILGLLAGLVAPAVLSRQADAQIGVAESDLASIESAIELYMSRNALQVPSMDQLLEEDEHGQPWIKGGTVKDGEFRDPWGNAYEIVHESGMKFYIVCYGPDGEEGTEDDIQRPEERDS